MKKPSPYLFEEFFASGREESTSPFLTSTSKKYARYLPLKTSLLSALFLGLSFGCSFLSPPLSSLFLLLVYFLSGTPALLASINDLKRFEINIDVLMTLAAFLSFLIGSQLEGGLLLVLFALSEAMEASVTKKTCSSFQQLKNLTPTEVTVIEDDGTQVNRSVHDLSLGAKLLVRAGDVIPLDGQVLEGFSFVSLAHLNGENTPVTKQQGDGVQAGSLNLDGRLLIQVNSTAHTSTLSRIIALIEEAQEHKPKIQRLLDRFGRVYAITIILLFLIFLVTLPLLSAIPFLGEGGVLYRGLSFLIAASPCALIIGAPTAYLSAMGACAKRGILLKGGGTLDALARCKTFAFDKTGTLTTGQLELVQILPLQTESCFDQEEAVIAAAVIEQYVDHPIAQAILACYREITSKRDPTSPLPQLVDFKSIPGYGAKGTLLHAQVAATDRIEIYIGSQALIEPRLNEEQCQQLHATLRATDKIVTFLLLGTSGFAFTFTDQVRNESISMIDRLKRRGLGLLMLTGDHQASSAQTAQRLGIDRYYYGLTPEDKLNQVGTLSEETGGLVMVGDGINDAPSLMRADVGISMGKIGSDTAVDASDIVFLSDDLSYLDWLYAKALKTSSIVKQNIYFALAIITLVSLPALLGIVPLYLAVLLHEGSTLIVSINSLRLLKRGG